MPPSTPFRTHLRLILPLLILTVTTAPAPAADRFVIVSGDWNSTATWSGGVVPTVNDIAWVGSASLATATVNLSQNVTTGHVILGRTAGSLGTLDIGNFTFTARDFTFGQSGAAAIIRGTGHLDVSGFIIGGGNSYTLPAVDIVHNDVGISGGATLSLSANLSIADTMDLRGAASTLNAQGFNISVTNQLLLGWNGPGAQLLSRGTITTGRMNVRGQNFDLTSSDNVNHFVMREGATNLGAGVVVGRLDLTVNATGTTTQTGNITGDALVESGSLLTLGANLSLSDSLNIRGTGSVLNANGHNISASSQFLLGWDAVGAQLLNRGTITTGRMNVRGQNFDLAPSDAVSHFVVREGATNLGAGVVVGRLDLTVNATGTTTQTGNITNVVIVEGGSSLTLGAPLSLSDGLNLRGAGVVLNANGHNVGAANQILIGWDGSGTPSVQNLGTLTTGALLLGNGMQLTLASGQDSAGGIHLRGNSRLTAGASGGGTGLTLIGSSVNQLVIEQGSHLTLSDNGTAGGWAFRWANPAGGDHVAALNALIAEGKIDFTFGGGYSVTSNDDGYTYILVPVPEPSSILALGAAAIAIGSILRRRRGATSPSA